MRKIQAEIIIVARKKLISAGKMENIFRQYSVITIKIKDMQIIEKFP